MDLMWHKCNILYYLRKKYYGRARNILDKITVQNSNNAELKFYHGISFILEGQLQKGIAELTLLQTDHDTLLGVLLALIYGYKLASSLDKDALYGLEAKMKEERKQSSPMSLYYAGLFLSLAEKYDKAFEYINKALKKDSNNIEVLILKGWNDTCMSCGQLQMATLDCLELAYNKSNTNPLALLGLSKYKYISKDYEESNLILDRLIVNAPGQVVPLMEKLQNEFAMQKWDSAYDTLDRILTLDPNNILGHQIRIFTTLCKQADYIEAADLLNRFYSYLEDEETHNGYLFFYNAQLFSKVCSRSSTVLAQVYRFAQYASEISPNDVNYLSEVGYQCILQGKVKEALNFFKAASKVDSNSITALCGLTLCQMSESGSTEQVAQQIELLFEMQGPKKIPLLYLLSAKLNKKISSNAVPYLNEAIEIKLNNTSHLPYCLDYIKELDPDFLLDVCKEYKEHLPKKPSIIVGYLSYTPETKSDSVNKCFNILEAICSACPGLTAALYELAKLKFLFGHLSDAQKLTQQIIDIDNTHARSQMLLAQIYIQKQAYHKAAQSLESCLSYNFKVKDSATYNFVNGIIYKQLNLPQEALTAFTNSLSILKNKTSAAVNKMFDADLNIVDRATLYLQIIELQSELGHSDAGITMQEAIQEFTYTSEEGRLLIVKADLALKKGDVDKAMDILNEIKPNQPYYFQAHTKLAHIYLKEKNDTNMFTTCFKEVVSNQPMTDAHVLMGDAYMSIHEPVLAMECFESALNDNPKSVNVIRKLGVALLKMHEFDKAVRHYSDSVKLLNDHELRFDYIDLLIKLKQYDKADSTITEELNKPQNKEKTIDSLKRRVKFLEKQASAREAATPISPNILAIITEAKEIQSSVVKRMEIESRSDLQEERQILASILCSLAKLKAVKEPAAASVLYSEALLYSPRNPEILLALAKLHAQMNNTEKCEQTLAVLLSTNPNNESAAVMMADLAFRKVDFESAQRHLSQILSVKPTAWEALAQLIEVQWRRGKLADAEQALEAASRVEGSREDPGYKYCAGICAMYSGKPNQSLRLLNQCRAASRWGAAAAKRMALLCLSQRLGDADANDDSETRILALRTAERLVSEVSAAERKPIQSLVLVASKQKSHAEKVLQDLQPIIADEAGQDDPYLILAVATAYNILKQPTRAKNILKRTISSMVWTPENADGLERCWLEVADSQINSGRTDAAKELLTKILNHNNSCATAYQYQGHLSEKDQNYKAAVQNFNNAWVHTGKSNLGLGYKLAHAYLKLKKYPECIVVCRHILSIHPDYPKIKKEILEKAKSNLRT